MAKNSTKASIKDSQTEMEKLIHQMEEAKAIENEMSRSLDSYVNGLKLKAKIEKNILENKIREQKLNSTITELSKEDTDSAKEKLKLLTLERDRLVEITKTNQTIVSNLNIESAKRKAINEEIKYAGEALSKKLLPASKDILRFLNEQDGVLKKMNLSLGTNNREMGDFTKNIMATTQTFGVTTDDLVKMQLAFVEATGKLTPLSQRNYQLISAIAKGVGMSKEDSALLVGNFDKLGMSVDTTKMFVEDLRNESANYGVSLSASLGKVQQHIDKLNKFSFKNGVKDLAEMAKYATRMNIDMEGTFSAMDKSRTLEGSLEMASQLMVMGGKFQQADPFKLMSLSRNDPKRFQEELNKMSEGMAVYSKSSKSFEISAYDLDRLRVVAEATGKDYGKLVEETRRFSEIKMAKSQLFSGTDEEREMIASIAKINNKTGRFEVQIGTDTKELSQLTKAEIAYRLQQKKTLEDSALDAATFDETWRSVVNEFKSGLLPLLTTLNSVLHKFQDFYKSSDHIISKSAKVIGPAILGLTAFKVIGGGLGKLAPILTSLPSMAFGKLGGMFSKGSGGVSIPKDPITTGGGPSATGTASNFARAASIAAIGVAAVGIGYGINLASKGLSELANSMSKLSDSQATKFMITGGVAIAGFTASLITLGTVGTATAPALIAVGAGAMLIGGAFAVASLGAKKFGEGLSIALSGVPAVINSISGGIKAIGESIAIISNPDILMVEKIKGVDFKPMSEAFKQANDFMKSDIGNITKLREQIELLKSTLSDNSFSNLTNTLSKGLEVRWAKDAQTTLESTITINLGDEKIVEKIVKRVDVYVKDMKKGTRANPI